MTARSKSENSGFCVFYILLTEVSIGFIAINMSALNITAPVIRDFINDSYTFRYGESLATENITFILTLAQSILMWGSILGGFLVTLVLKIRSRKRSMLLIHVINVISAILMGPVAKFGRSYEALIIGRFLSGIARGFSFATSSVVAAETSCRQTLALFQSPYWMTISLSLTLGAILGLDMVLGTPELWFWIVTIPAISSIIYFCFYPWLPETPVMLLRQGRYDKAKETLKKFRVAKCDLETELQTMQKEIEVDPQRKPLPITTILKTPHLRLQLFHSIIVISAHGFAGIQGILFYSSTLLKQAGVEDDSAAIATIAIYLQSFVAYALYWVLEKRVGVKKIFLAGASISVIGMATFTITNAMQHTTSWLSYVALTAMCLTIFGNRLGPQVTMQGLIAELTTAASRLTVTYYAGLTFWVKGAITTLVLPYSVAAWGAYAYIPYIVLSLAVVTFIAYAVPNTHNRTTAQIQQSLRNKSVQGSGETKQTDHASGTHNDNRAYVSDE